MIQRQTLLILILFGSTHLACQPVLADWSTFQHDNARSGATDATLPGKLAQAWVYQSPVRPRPAWDEPAIWDGWSKTHNLTNRQVFDKAFHVAAAGDAVYFGSSVDDQVHCVDAATGRRRWRFFTEGPVRLAPTVANGRVYVGSDDGFVYCLTADEGKLIWRCRPGPTDRRLAGNGRVISQWPIRTGVVVVGNRAFCGAGVIPSDGVYVCALDAKTGAEVWKTEMNDLPAQGYLLASTTRVYVVTSRDRPLVFDAATGKRLHQVQGGAGGTYALLTGDTLFYGPSKTGEVTMVGPGKPDVLASFAGNHMIVSQPLSYLHSGEKLSGLDRDNYVRLYAKRKSVEGRKQRLVAKLKKAAEASTNSHSTDAGDEEEGEETKIRTLKQQVVAATAEIKTLDASIKACVKWTTKCDCPLSLVLAGETLIAGGDGRVSGYDAVTGNKQWSQTVPGKAYGLAVSGERLFVSTDHGTIHCFADVDTANLPAISVESTPAPIRSQSYLGPLSPSNYRLPNCRAQLPSSLTRESSGSAGKQPCR